MYNPLDLARVVFDRLQNMECFCGCDCGFSSHDMRQKGDKKHLKENKLVNWTDTKMNILFLLLLIQHCIRVYTDLCICCSIVAFNRDRFNAIHKDFDKGSPEEAKDFKGHVTRGNLSLQLAMQFLSKLIF